MGLCSALLVHPSLPLSVWLSLMEHTRWRRTAGDVLLGFPKPAAAGPGRWGEEEVRDYRVTSLPGHQS